MNGKGTGRGGGKRWSKRELAILRKHFPSGGLAACGPLLRRRTDGGIRAMAKLLELEDPAKVPAAGLRPPLCGKGIERAVELHCQGWSYAAIAREFGVCESTATNAVLIGRCRAAGYEPAKRDASGGLVVRDVKRLRALLMQGLRGTEIQLRLGISASCVSNHRKKLAAELRGQGKAKTLPPPGGGEAYSGRRVPAAERREIERLLLEGYGTPSVSRMSGSSKTTVGRVRSKLVRRLSRKGECLPGCDLAGIRRKQKTSTHFIPDETRAALIARLRDRWPVRRAAIDVGMGLSSAYKIRDALAAEMAERGECLPRPLLPGRDRSQCVTAWLPADKLWRYRTLCHEHGTEEARRLVREEIAAERQADRARRKTFEEQLEAVRKGAPLVGRFVPSKAAPDATLGGVATGMIA